MLIYVILLSSDCFKVQGHLVPRLYRLLREAITEDDDDDIKLHKLSVFLDKQTNNSFAFYNIIIPMSLCFITNRESSLFAFYIC